MTNPYLDRLRGRFQEKQHPSLPSKPSKPGFEGIEGDQGCHFFENEQPTTPKNATPAYPQNVQNPCSPSVPDDGTQVTLVELPAVGLRYRRTYAHLQLKPPHYIPIDRWRLCIEDGRRFLMQWGEQAQALNWSSADLFALHQPPAKPHPSYNRLSRYDATGLVWLLEGREVVALTEATATIRNHTGAITTYRRFNKPALGPVGDWLEDFVP